ncbi:hypothetical protein DEU56DRAFT_916666 [Suillus clintonianus]|uniref:uncharacterized protein n=1 Tax=Suillus clintonianus TaxID=1904413 RepID=UPI001B87D731|nr:uncharacterized protein DEU56DRAFT_916666 [Suillus clintonianus]KAG2125162.1 hypothetical protein DEU56DRAFT_916666 [Suillus clintonianus]
MLHLQLQFVRYGAHRCPWDLCLLLHGPFSNPKFLNDDIINKTKLTFIKEHQYHYSFSTLREALVRSTVAMLLDTDLRDIAHVMHDRGTKSLCEETRANVEEGKKFVENYLVEHHDIPEADTRVVTTKWYNEVVECRLYYKNNGHEFDKLSLQGGMMSWWETGYCPALLGGDKIREKDVVNFFNNTGVALDKMIIEVQGYDMVKTLSKDAREWCDTSTMLVFPLSSANITSRHGSGSRKPDAVLMKQAPRTDTFQWANFISVMEIKYRDSSKLNSDTISYMGEIAHLVLTNQINRQYFVGLNLLGSNLSICVHTHGGSSITEPIDIYWDVEKYLKIIAWFKYANLGYIHFRKAWGQHRNEC